VNLSQQGGDLAAFEKTIGPVEQVQAEWHHHVRRLKAALSGKDRRYFKTGILPEEN